MRRAPAVEALYPSESQRRDSAPHSTAATICCRRHDGMAAAASGGGRRRRRQAAARHSVGCNRVLAWPIARRGAGALGFLGGLD